MRHEDISLELRPRGAYEATDLGVRLVQRNAGAVYRAWLVFAVPLMFLMALLGIINPWLPAVLLWWFKPVYDRVVLHVLSRAVFGERVTLPDMAAGWRQWLGNGLLGALTWRRFELARAFTLPVFTLEGLKGKRRRQRNKVLQKNTRAQAVLAQLAYLHIEYALHFSAIVLLTMMMPVYTSVPIWSWMAFEDMPAGWTFVASSLYVLVLSAVEPAYVGAGFALYLNRRVELEAWDIELTLRRALDGEGGATLDVPAGRAAA